MIFPKKIRFGKGFNTPNKFQNLGQSLWAGTGHLYFQHLACRKPTCSWQTLDIINLPDNKTWFLVGHENTSFDKENQKQNKTNSPISLHRSW
jgi:hypothetical protein